MLSFKQLAVSLVAQQSRITSLEVVGHLFEKKPFFWLKWFFSWNFWGENKFHFDFKTSYPRTMHKCTLSLKIIKKLILEIFLSTHITIAFRYWQTCISKKGTSTITFAKAKLTTTNAYINTASLSTLPFPHQMYPKTFDKEAITEHLIVTAAKRLYWIWRQQ